MIDSNMQYCFIRCLVDKISPVWIENCNFVNLYGEKNKKRISILYTTDDRKRILYITNRIYAVDSKNGMPWSQKFTKYLKMLFPHELTNTLFSYSGLFFNEFSHNHSLLTLSEYMRCEDYNPNIICNYLENLKLILKYHLSVFCFSENLLLIDKNSNSILLPSYNYVISLTNPIFEDLYSTFKHKLHPIVVKHFKNLKTKSNHIANTGLYNPLRMKQICTRLVDKEAAIDRVYLLSSIIYFFSVVGTLWKLKLNLSWQLSLNVRKNKNGCIGGLCSLSKNQLSNIELKQLIHDYICESVVVHLPVKLKKAHSLYPEFINALSDLQRYLQNLG